MLTFFRVGTYKKPSVYNSLNTEKIKFYCETCIEYFIRFKFWIKNIPNKIKLTAVKRPKIKKICFEQCNFEQSVYEFKL